MLVVEIGKHYRHTTGSTLAILGRLDTTMWGKNTLIAESNKKGRMTELVAVGSEESATVNYFEMSKDEWMKASSK